MPDRTSQPAEGERQRYTLPNEYGPARPPRSDDAYESTPSVIIRGRDEPVTATPAESVPDEPTPPPMSRREIREQARTKSNGRKPRSTRSKWIRRGVAVAIVVLLVPVAVSYVHAVQRPGTDTVGVRTVEWIRDNGGNGVVNTIERWWYTNNPPPTGGSPDAIRVQDTVGNAVQRTTAPITIPKLQRLAPPTARVATPAASVEPNEGVWQPTGRLVLGQPAVYTTYVRPDALHTSNYTGLMWLDTKLLRATYVVGLQEPGGGSNPWNSQVPDSERPNLVAAFNSGFKMASARGGAYLDGTEIKPLVQNSASLVIFNDGSATVGAWGRDVTMGPTVKAVRQNLELIVDGGQLNPALQENDTNAFGATLGNNVYVWRSGVGVTAGGALVYAGGPAMSIPSLARTLQAAGAVRAMELDINTDWVSAYTYGPSDPNAFNSPTIGIKLLDNMSRSGDRYLQPGERDFFAFSGDPKPEVAVTTTTTPTTTTTKKK